VDGYVAELLTKALSQHELDQPLTAGDREMLISYLRRAGALDERGRYQGSDRRGTDAAGRITPSLPLHDLLASGALEYLPLAYEYQPTMLQVTGGADRLPAAFAARLRDRIVYRAAAREIRQTDRAVSVVYADAAGRLHTADGAYCVCALPLSVLSGLPTDFAPEYQKVIASVEYGVGGKIGLQFKRRFWEEDEGLFGGITRTDQEITQIVYPSHGFQTRKGVLIGYYIQGPNGRPMGERTPAERLRVTLEQGGRIHPQYATEFENGFSVAWHRVPYSRGSWASFSAEARRAGALLRRPDRRLYLAGDHLSSQNAWMQGAFESAREVATGIHARALAGA
jgi:monoamine oxidase